MPRFACLQGGAEFTAPCAEMDALVLRRSGGGPATVLAAACAPGREYAAAAANAERHLTELGATDVVIAPDPFEDAAGAAAAVSAAALVVIPGGSPQRLRDVLVGTALGAAVVAAPAILGSSAGAMLLGSHTVLPDGDAHPVTSALGVVPDCLVLPHFAGELRWVDVHDHGLPGLVLGIPECSGALVEGNRVTAVGARAVAVYDEGSRHQLRVGDTWERQT